MMENTHHLEKDYKYLSMVLILLYTFVILVVFSSELVFTNENVLTDDSSKEPESCVKKNESRNERNTYGKNLK